MSTMFPLDRRMSTMAEDLPPSAWVGHVPFAMWLVAQARPLIFVELGTHHGTSFLAFCQAIRDISAPTKAHAVDTWQGDEHAGFYDDAVHTALQALVQQKYAGFAQLMRMRFDQALEHFADGSVDLLHIDGLHTYEAVSHDFESWLPKLSDRGVVLFHDTMVRERDFGVWRLWDELSGRYPSFEFQHTHGLGVLLVGQRQPESLRALCDATDGATAEIRALFQALGGWVEDHHRRWQLEEKFTESQKFMGHYRVMAERHEAESSEARAQADAAARGLREVSLMVEGALHSQGIQMALPSETEARAQEALRRLLTRSAEREQRIAELEAGMLSSTQEQARLQQGLQDSRAARDESESRAERFAMERNDALGQLARMEQLQASTREERDALQTRLQQTERSHADARDALQTRFEQTERSHTEARDVLQARLEQTERSLAEALDQLARIHASRGWKVATAMSRVRRWFWPR